MKTLINKVTIPYDYSSRYNTVPYYFNTKDNKYMRGVAKNMSKQGRYTIHTLEPTDTLDGLAFKYYGRPDLFWAIANFNDVQDCFENLSERYNFLYIPEYSDIRFKE